MSDSVGEKREFNESALDVEEQLQAASRCMARVNIAAQKVRASVDISRERAAPLIRLDRLMAAREARNASCRWALARGRPALMRSRHPEQTAPCNQGAPGPGRRPVRG
jgi:hypothetical protein